MSILFKFKKSIRKSHFIIICIVSMLVFVSLISSCIENARLSSLEANNEKSNNYIQFSFNEALKNEDIKNIINKISENDNIILSHLHGLEFQAGTAGEGIYFNENFTGGYNLLEGRFFNRNDFKSNSKVVVIGKDVLKMSKMENEKRYIYRGTDRYEVIGVIGKKNLPTRYDSLVLYNLNEELNEGNIKAELSWTLDSKSKSESELKQIINKINSSYNNAIVLKEKYADPNPLSTAISSSNYTITNFSLVIICILLSLIKAISYWIESIKLEIGVRKAFGASNNKLCLTVLGRYTLISIIGIVVSLVIQKILLIINAITQSTYALSYINIICSIGFIILLGFIFIGVSMLKIDKIEPSELLKGN